MSRSEPGLAQPEQDGLTQTAAAIIDDWLPEQLIKSSIPGAAVAVVDDSAIVWQRAFGYLDQPGSRLVDSETLFCVRSLAKGVTALAVLMAVQKGLLNLDIPIKEYLPGFTVHSRFDARPEEIITLRHLLSHWAGFTHEAPLGNNLDDPDYDLDAPDYFEKHVESISDTWLRFPVGYRYAYTNLDYDLAGYILQVRSGMPFVQYVKENVLDPIGMTSSSYDAELVEKSDNRALGHAPNSKIEPLRCPEMPAAGLYSNVFDMAKYIQFHLGDGTVGDTKILRQDLMEQLHSIQYARPNQQTGYCLGIFRQLVSNTFSFSHSGGGHGFQNQVILYPELGFGVLLLTNRDGHGLTEAPLQKIIDDLVRERFGPNPVFEPGIKRMRKLPPDDPRIQSIMGRYWDGDNWTIGIENDVLGMRTNAQNFYPLTFYDDGGELVGIFGETIEIRFLQPCGDQRGSLVSNNQHLLNCNFRAFNDSPLDPPGLDEKDWQVYFGDYEILWDNEPFSTIGITQKNGYLYYGEAKCIEYAPGLFFTCDGEALDFRSNPPTAANLVMRRRESQTT